MITWHIKTNITTPQSINKDNKRDWNALYMQICNSGYTLKWRYVGKTCILYTLGNQYWAPPAVLHKYIDMLYYNHITLSSFHFASHYS